MTTKTRIAKVERAHAAKSPRGRIAIFHEHAETVRVNGVEMSRAEWDKTAKDNAVHASQNDSKRRGASGCTVFASMRARGELVH